MDAIYAKFPPNYEPIIDSSFAINVNIHIACETMAEVMAHLDEIRMQIGRTFKQKEDVSEWVVTDNNCYGIHIAQINQ